MKRDIGLAMREAEALFAVTTQVVGCDPVHCTTTDVGAVLAAMPDDLPFGFRAMRVAL